MTTTSGNPNDRFHRFLRQGLDVVCRHVVADDANTPLTEETRKRALNLLGYAFQSQRIAFVWAEARDLLLTLAPKMEHGGQWEEWFSHLEAGAKRAAAQGDPVTTATLYLHSGVLHRLQSNYAQAESYLTESATLFQTQAKPRAQARALNQLGYVARYQNRLGRATELAHQALALLEEEDVERAMSFSLLGLIAKEQRQWSEAEIHHRRALELREKAQHLREMAWSMQNLADVLRVYGEYETAISYFERAIALLDQVQDPVHRAIAQMNLGVIYSLQKQPFKAFPLYEAAERIFRQVGSRQNLAMVKVNQGLEYMAVESWEKAETAFRLGADLYQSLADQGGHLNALDGLGLSYLEQGRYAEALMLFERIVNELQEIEGNYFFRTLRDQLPEQIARSKAGLATG
ncbi:MAG: tetratricopeptide repeat protein [Caldilineaceae bacterium]|nr:tetratricopeptide repeat protein [Caldilineaceae bacterium]